MIIFNFNALAQPAETLGQRQPSPESRRLWDSFFTKYMGRIHVVVDSSLNQDLLKEWLKREGFKASSIQPTPDIVRDGSNPAADAVWRITSALGRAHFYVDSDLETCQLVVKQGIPALHLQIPTFIRPEFHTPNAIRSWDVVVDEMETKALKDAEKTWGDI